jgi:hypothetical protein
VASTWSYLAEKWQANSHGGKPTLSRQVPYQGWVGVLLTDAGIVGAAGAESQEQLQAIFTTLVGIPPDAGE